MVKSHIPEITIPELPDDPAEYTGYLMSLNLFETASYTQEDSERTKQYQEEVKRSVVQKTFANEDEFLSSLGMVSEVNPFDEFSIPRIAQLTQRSNQFNLRTIRYIEEDIKKIASSDGYLTLCFTLKDKFGDYGLICAIILKKENDSLFIDTWIMSCRILKRGLESFVLNTIAVSAKQNGFKRLSGEYIPTAKNALVKSHYQELGFYAENNNWGLDVASYKVRECFITQKESAR